MTIYDYCKKILDLNEEFIKVNSEDQADLNEKVFNKEYYHEHRDLLGKQIDDLDLRVKFTGMILNVVGEFYDILKI